MLIQHELPPGWEDTDEPGKIQPSAVVGLAHVLTMEPGDIEALRGPAGPQGPQGVQGPAGSAVVGAFAVGSYAVLIYQGIGVNVSVWGSGVDRVGGVSMVTLAGVVGASVGGTWRNMGPSVGVGNIVLALRVG